MIQTKLQDLQVEKVESGGLYDLVLTDLGVELDFKLELEDALLLDVLVGHSPL